MTRQNHAAYLEFQRCRVHIQNLYALKVQRRIALIIYTIQPNINQFTGPVIADHRINTGIRRRRSVVRLRVKISVADAAIADVLAVRQCTEGCKKTCDRAQPTAMPG